MDSNTRSGVTVILTQSEGAQNEGLKNISAMGYFLKCPSEAVYILIIFASVYDFSQVIAYF